MVRKIFVVLFLSPWFSLLFLVNSQIKAQPSERVNCVRSTPQPIVKKSVFPNTKFVLKNIDYVGVVVPLGLETVEFANGDKLAITNSGCEYFSLSFQFETSRFAGNVQDTRYWFARSIDLMNQTQQGLEPPVDIQQGIKALEKYSKNNQHPLVGQEIDYGGQEIRSVVKLAEVKKTTEGNSAVTVIFSVGPL
jgi:hypothetical protein